MFRKGTVNGMRFTNVLQIGLMPECLKKIFEILSMKDDFAELFIDSTYVKVHKAAAGEKKGFNCYWNFSRW